MTFGRIVVVLWGCRSHAVVSGQATTAFTLITRDVSAATSRSAFWVLDGITVLTAVAAETLRGVEDVGLA